MVTVLCNPDTKEPFTQSQAGKQYMVSLLAHFVFN